MASVLLLGLLALAAYSDSVHAVHPYVATRNERGNRPLCNLRHLGAISLSCFRDVNHTSHSRVAALTWRSSNVGSLEKESNRYSKARCTIGANKDAADDDGATPMFMTAENGHAQVLKMLLAAGANKDAANNEGATPMTVAAQNGDAKGPEDAPCRRS